MYYNVALESIYILTENSVIIYMNVSLLGDVRVAISR